MAVITRETPPVWKQTQHTLPLQELFLRYEWSYSEKGKTFQLKHFSSLDPRHIYMLEIQLLQAKQFPRNKLKRLFFLALAIIHMQKQVQSSHLIECLW